MHSTTNYELARCTLIFLHTHEEKLHIIGFQFIYCKTY